MRPTIDALPGSHIREVANAGIGRSDLLAFWFCESDEVTPIEVRQAAADSMARGETYSHNLGLAELRDTRCPALTALPGVVSATPPGGMYVFFRVPGADDSLAFAKRLVREVGLGLAPGVAFGAEGEGGLRWCFASQDLGRVRDGVDRLRSALPL